MGKILRCRLRHHERFDQAHSKVFEELTTKGVLGLTTYLLIWLAMAAVLLASFRRRTGWHQVFIAVIGATAAAYFVQNLFLFDTTTTTLLFALLGRVPDLRGAGAWSSGLD